MNSSRMRLGDVAITVDGSGAQMAGSMQHEVTATISCEDWTMVNEDLISSTFDEWQA